MWGWVTWDANGSATEISAVKNMSMKAVFVRNMTLSAGVVSLQIMDALIAGNSFVVHIFAKITASARIMGERNHMVFAHFATIGSYQEKDG